MIIDKLNFINSSITNGIKRVISISKIKKISLIRKNWILKGKWLIEIGSNPHSNGDIFSWSIKDFFEIKIFNNIRKEAIVKRVSIVIIMIIIIYIKWFKYFNWKLNVMNYTI